jgi:two-component system, cell cycle sensor histidine kinase and response regulator CckA
MGIFSPLLRMFEKKDDDPDSWDKDLYALEDDSQAMKNHSTDCDTQEVDLEDIIAMGSKPPPQTLKQEVPVVVAPREGHCLGASLSDRLLLESLMENLSDYVYFKDRDCRFIMVNQAFAEKVFFIPDPKKIEGRTDFDFFPQEYAAASFEKENQIMSSGIPQLGKDIKMTLPDGRVAWLLANTFPLRDQRGAIIGTWGIVRDISAQKRAEEELRTSEEMLRQTQKMEAFGQLAGGIAHDFNNMLSVILGSAQLVELSFVGDNPDLKHNIAMVIDTSKKAAELTQQLLAFTRKGNCNVVEMDFHDVVRSVANLLRHTFDKRIKIVERLDASQSSIKGDFVLLQNALLNLSINAQDAMPQGGTLTFSTATIGPDDADRGADKRVRKIARQGSYLRIMIADTGTGMDEKIKLRAFEPFFTTKAPGKGTGLGLASVYGTVKNHNGLIDFETEVGKGTTFNLYFPLIVQSPEEPTATEESVSTDSRTVMVIDDEEHVRLLVAEMLKSMGFMPVCKKSGDDAVNYFRDHHQRIDVIIVDLVMPGMNSNYCIKALKQINPLTPIIISSGYNLVTDTQQIIAKGIAGFLQKPFEMGELSHVVSKALANR